MSLELRHLTNIIVIKIIPLNYFSEKSQAVVSLTRVPPIKSLYFRGSIPGENGVKTELHVLRKGQ